ncbi:MAG: thiamine phosphate synthase [Negativibacillus sp.]|nr:thiamine phosphate synthase [Negativibacillus sp.]
MNCSREMMRLYAVTDRSWLNGQTLYEQVEQALKGGVTLVQLREKGLGAEQFLQEARQIQQLCRRFGVPLIINDSIEVALAVDADGVHLGQDDANAAQARQLLGKDKIIGVSAHNVQEALQAVQDGADYLGSGAVFGSGTKTNVSTLPMQTLREICSAVPIPVVAIGGITEQNLQQLSGSGIAGAAVVSAIFAQENIEEAAIRLRGLLSQMQLD